MSTGPNIADPQSMTPQMYDGEVVSAHGSAPAADWTPTVAGKNFARAFTLDGAGIVKADLLGVGGSGGATAVLIPLPAGKFEIAVTQIYSGAHGTTATGITAYY